PAVGHDGGFAPLPDPSLRAVASGRPGRDRARTAGRLLAAGAAGAPRLAPAGRLRWPQGAASLRTVRRAHGWGAAAGDGVGSGRRARAVPLDALSTGDGVPGHRGDDRAPALPFWLPVRRSAGRALSTEAAPGRLPVLGPRGVCSRSAPVGD